MLLLEIAKDGFNDKRRKTVHFVENPTANQYLNDIEDSPHMFVLACLMDRQIKAERAWLIPFSVCEMLGKYELRHLETVSLDTYRKIFNEGKLHRFNDDMAGIFMQGVKRIGQAYKGNASKIWNGNPSSAAVVFRFMEFNGIGPKLSTMAANILARDFKIPFSDYYSIDISTDVHILRVVERIGLVEKDASNEMVRYKAREINPEYPGIIDYSCWEIGRKWCRPKDPECKNCPIEKECGKRF